MLLIKYLMPETFDKSDYPSLHFWTNFLYALEIIVTQGKVVIAIDSRLCLDYEFVSFVSWANDANSGSTRPRNTSDSGHLVSDLRRFRLPLQRMFDLIHYDSKTCSPHRIT